MAKVEKRENENIEDLLRRFKRMVNEEGILHDVKKHVEFIPKPVQRREKRKENEAKRRRAARAARLRAEALKRENPMLDEQ